MNALPARMRVSSSSDFRDEAVAAGVRDEIALARLRIDDVREPRARRELDERGERHAVALAAGDVGGLHAERAAGRIDRGDVVHRARLEDRRTAASPVL